MSVSPAAVPSVQLGDGVRIPQIGFGTFQIPPEDTQRAVEQALELGYRHIDTAAGYDNEAGVGAALRATGLERPEVFVTTKLRNVDQGADRAREAFEASRQALGIEVVDLYLIHWPVPSRGLYVETWETLVGLAEGGAARAVGVSNFLPEHLERLAAATGVAPAVNQIEVHPSFSQAGVREASLRRGIAVEAYSPLGQGGDLRDPVVTGIAGRLGLTPAQAVLAWHLRSGRIIIPKSTHRERMRENLESVRTASLLAPEDLDALEALDRGPAGRIGGDPAIFAFPQTREDAAARGEGLD
jgi:diketogulonate reductase-like aldo/keto reductase